MPIKSILSAGGKEWGGGAGTKSLMPLLIIYLPPTESMLLKVILNMKEHITFKCT